MEDKPLADLSKSQSTSSPSKKQRKSKRDFATQVIYVSIVLGGAVLGAILAFTMATIVAGGEEVGWAELKPFAILIPIGLFAGAFASTKLVPWVLSKPKK